MRLIDTLERALLAEESLFRAQLLREDIARLRKLEALARSAPDAAAFVASGMRVGWTAGEARTTELAEPLRPFLEAVFADDEARMLETWEALHRVRMERLLGCLSTPAPKPVE